MPYCYTCKKSFASMGIARHRAMHRDKREGCEIEDAEGKLSYPFAELPRPHIITKRWLLKCRTPAGGWTKAQLEVLGISWPPMQGWHDTVIGNSLTALQRDRFCSLKNKKARRRK